MDIIDSPDYKNEMDYLKNVLEYLEKYCYEIRKQKNEIDENVTYSRTHFNADNTEQYTEFVMNKSRQEYITSRLKLSVKALLKPYFARVDFIADDEKILQRLYIGKMSLIRDEDNFPLVIDWRAPISGLYYEGRLGEACYTSPDGVISGEITLKRQYMIENGKMDQFFDIDVTASDDFLQAALGASKDKRLKDIVSTIQAEQNKVIRANMLKPLIVQGAAGGGKTTVALHRIAYLLYNYEKRLSPQNIMIIAPNRMFLSYISEVLPDLGVENVLQTTFNDFACEFIDEKLNVKSASQKMAFLIDNPQFYNAVARFATIKSSLKFKKLIDRYLDHIILNLIPQKDFVLGEHILIRYEKIEELLCKTYRFLPVSKRLFEIKKLMSATLRKKHPVIIKNINADFDFRVELIKEKMIEDTEERRQKIMAILDMRDALVSETNKLAKNAIKQYLKNSEIKRTSIYYKKLFEDEGFFAKMGKGLFREKDLRALFQFTAKIMAQKSFEEEDIPPIFYMHYKLNGRQNFDLRHIVIDEAQDTSLFQLYVLKEIMQSDSFTILGDLCQGIYAYKGISDWDEVNSKIFGGKGDYQTLKQSYRTTIEIMDFANIAIGKLDLRGIPLARPVIRHGDVVCVAEMQSLEEIARFIGDKISEFEKKGYQSMAIICKNVADCMALFGLVKSESISVLSGNEDSYKGGIVIMPAYLTKGLEFDSVIIADAGEGKYGYSELDIKLIYIAMTRALHELGIVSMGKITELLKQ